MSIIEALSFTEIASDEHTRVTPAKAGAYTQRNRTRARKVRIEKSNS